MKKSAVCASLPDNISKMLKLLQRREVYKIIHAPGGLRGLPYYNNYVVQVTHFHKEALRCKVLATKTPIKMIRNRAHVGRLIRQSQGLPFGAPTDLNIISIPYEKLSGLEFKRVPLVEIPLYINEATPLYKRYLAEVQHAPGVYS